MLDEGFSPALGSQAESLNVGKVMTHNSKSIGRIRTVLKFLGPAFIVSVAYIDPGNLKLEHFFFSIISEKTSRRGTAPLREKCYSCPKSLSIMLMYEFNIFSIYCPLSLSLN